MTTQNRVAIEELRRATARVLDTLAGHGIDSIPITRDYFWSIDPAQEYSVNERPTEFSIGQVSESYKWLTSDSQSNDEPVTYSLVWLGGLLHDLVTVPNHAVSATVVCKNGVEG